MHAPRVRARRCHMSRGHSYPRMPHVDFPPLCVALRGHRHRMECNVDYEAIGSDRSLLADSSGRVILQRVIRWNNFWRNYWGQGQYGTLLSILRSFVCFTFAYLWVYLCFMLSRSNVLAEMCVYQLLSISLSPHVRSRIVLVNPSG